jgi:hypothetical protein
MSYEFYKILHLFGLMLLFFGFGGLLMAAYSGQALQKKARIMAFATHGLGILIIFVSGFGLAARLGYISQLPNWVYAKLGVWVLMGIAISVVKRKGHIGWPVATLLLGLGVTAAYLGVTKSL